MPFELEKSCVEKRPAIGYIEIEGTRLDDKEKLLILRGHCSLEQIVGKNESTASVGLVLALPHTCSNILTVRLDTG